MRTPEEELKELEQSSLLRTLRPVDSPQCPHSIIHGKDTISFASNDYLGLATHPALIASAKDSLDKWGTGSGASRLITGSLSPHRELETYLAEAKKTEAAITFANGYATSVGTLSALLSKGDTVILDKLSHASLVDGARLSGATIRVFPHNNLDKLEKLLGSVTKSATPESRTIIVTESIFSMDGDHAPLKEIIALKKKYGVLLLVDEAHALGVFGSTGMGLAEQLDCSEGIDFHMGTLGKAAGSAGGYIATTSAFVDLIINRARSFIYSTAAPPAQTATSLTALKLIRSEEGKQIREKLWRNLRFFSELTDSPLPESAIIPWIIGDSQKALDLSNKLFTDHGILAPAVRYPTVARNSARLRITITAAHSEEDIKLMVDTLNAVH